MVLLIRSPLSIVLGIIQPCIYLILFAPLLKPALASTTDPLAHTNTMLDAYRVYVPGMLVALAIANGLFAGFSLLQQIASGVVERSRVTSISRVALLIGRSLEDVVIMIAQGILVVLLSLTFGLFLQIPE